MDPWKSNYKSKQGNIGLGEAIAYFTSIGVPVMIPLNDTQKYDLVVELNNKLLRVSVKTTQHKSKKSGNFSVLLKRSGGAKNKIILFDNTTCELLFIYTIDGIRYLIPSEKVSVKTSLTLTSDLSKYIV